jgi:hypothetical protein
VARLPTRPFVLARRSDQLGSRLNAIINARALAQLLGLEFRFVWPRTEDRSVTDPSELFGRSFLDEFELDRETLEGVRGVSYNELMGMTPAERASVLDGGSEVFVESADPFVVLRPDATDADTATRRYRRCFEGLGWNRLARGLLDGITAPAGILGMHVRAGDIVTGRWRHAVAHQKYVPTALVRHALAVFAAGDRGTLLLSDSAEFAAHLRSRFAVLTPEELVPGYERLTEAQRALADIVLLSSCDPIVGPTASGFNRLAANLCGATVARTDGLAPVGEERELVLAGIAEARELARESELWHKLAALDICWLLDVFGDTFELSEQRKLAADAVRLDPEHGGSLCRLGRVAAVAGNRRAAVEATARAVALAERIETDVNSLFEALASQIIAMSLAFEGGSTNETIDRAYERLGRLGPHLFQQEKVLSRLSHLIEVSRSLSCGPWRRRWALRRRVRRAMRLPPEAVGWHTDGLAQQRARPLFDPLTRDLDRITRYLSRSLDNPPT